MSAEQETRNPRGPSPLQNAPVKLGHYPPISSFDPSGVKAIDGLKFAVDEDGATVTIYDVETKYMVTYRGKELTGLDWLDGELYAALLNRTDPAEWRRPAPASNCDAFPEFPGMPPASSNRTN